MIVVLGRPSLVPPAPADAAGSNGRPGGLPAEIAVAARAGGAEVELLGTIGDDPEGDIIAVGLGREGIGHAALLRDPAGRTPIVGIDRGRLPRLDADDIELGLRYLPDYRVLVVAEPLGAEGRVAAVDGASFQGAAVVAVVPAASDDAAGFPESATILEAPADAGTAFGELVGRYAASLDRGESPENAFATARAATGWESPSA
ncbi:MAG TPA: hypothetical protein VGQ47_03745 [Candidatus Limnocylindrales bacterium]|nr:hypothetical protein [Candidatus Limnocylindrales bacterium]